MGAVQYYTTLQGWTRQAGFAFAHKEWHRIDIIITDISGQSGGASYYMDGQLINPTPIDCAPADGFKSFGLFCNTPTGLTSTGDYCLMDNLSVTRTFTGDGLQLHAIGADRVALQDGSLELRLSERVDPSLLTEENIVIYNESTGLRVLNFNLSDVHDSGFRVNFQGEIDAGRCAIQLSDSIVGEITQNPVRTDVQFRTEAEVEHVETAFADFDFNTYTQTDGSLPRGFQNLENAAYYAQSVSGRSGESGDHALGFIDSQISRQQTRFVYAFDDSISAGAAYNVTFDVFSENTYWYLYLLEDGDLDTGNGDYKNNIAIASANNAGRLGYAPERSGTRVTALGDDAVAAPGEWHSISLQVVPQTDGSTQYGVAVDDGPTVWVDTNRAFASSATHGFGLGYIAFEEASRLYFDNVKIMTDMEVVYPDIEGIFLYSFDGSMVDGSSVTSMIQRGVVEFNTLVDEQSAFSAVTVYENDVPMDCGYTLEDADGRSRLVLTFPELLTPDQTWRIEASPGIASRYASGIVSSLPFSMTFSTIDDAGIRVFAQDFNEDETVWYTSFAKNSSAKTGYTIAVCGYQYVDRVIDGEVRSVPEMTHIRLVPVLLLEDDKGIFHFELDADFAEQCDEIKTYLWGYPDLGQVETASDGTVL